MKILFILLALFGAVVVLVLVIGALLPRHHRVSREITLRRPPQEIFSLVRDFGSAPTWRSQLRKVEMLESVDGRVHFREESKHGKVTYELMEESAGARLVTRIVDLDLGYSGSWTYEFSGVPNGTRVRITEDGEVSNILFRFVARFIFGHSSTIDTYLLSLGAKFGEEVSPR